jgi:hypothetical protein
MRKIQKEVGRGISDRKIVARYYTKNIVNWRDRIQDTT